MRFPRSPWSLPAVARRFALLTLILSASACSDSTAGPDLGDQLSPGSMTPGTGSLSVRADNPTALPGDTFTLRAAADRDGERVATAVTWRTLDGGELIQSAADSGAVTTFISETPGTYRVVGTERASSTVDTAVLTVVDPAMRQAIVSLEMRPGQDTMGLGDTLRFAVWGTNMKGDSVPAPVTLGAEGGQVRGLDYIGTAPGRFEVRAGVPGTSLTVSASVTVAAAAQQGSDSTAPSSPPSTTPPVVSTPLAPVSSGAAPELPRVTLDTRYVPPTGNTIVVPAGGDLQAALNAAQRGDVVQLAAGATFTGNFTLPAKPGTGWVTITSATPLPPAGTRVTPQAAANFAKLQSSNSAPAIKTAASGDASYYRLMGIEVRSSAPMTYALVQLYNGAATSVSQIPQWIILDRVYVHGAATQTIQRCVMLNSRSSAVIDSWLAECHGKGLDTQAIIGWSSPGPFSIENNHLEGAGENILFGGADPAIAGVVPSDITIRRNDVVKPLSWKGVWTVKNLFETKNAQRVLVEDNIFENNWLDGQTGFAFVLKSQNQGGLCNWCVSQDLTIRGNLIKNSPGGFNLAATQTFDGGTAIPANTILIENNIFQDVAQSEQAGARILFQVLGGMRDVTIAHNTGFTDDKITMFDGAPTVRVIIRDNLFSRGTYGVFGGSKGEGTAALAYYAPDGAFRGNIVVAAPASRYPTGNYYPATSLTVGMADYAGGDFTLTSASPYASAGTDGTAPGANSRAIINSLASVR